MEATLEADLFGHRGGGYPGAERPGKVAQAQGGTLFLDEVSEMPPDLQVKFLRVLEEKRVTPVGGNDAKDVDFRLIAATNRDLAKEHDKPVTGVTPAALTALVEYEWPGNVRELKNVVESAVLFAPGSRIDVGELPAPIRAKAGEAAPPEEDDKGVATFVPSSSLVGKTMAEIEKEAILTALQASGGNRRNAAERLGIGLRTLQRKLKEYRGEPAGEGGEDEDEGDATNP
jgi:DNA-binding NtrC family response regulator